MQTRRGFIKSTAAAAAAGILPTGALADALGANSFSEAMNLETSTYRMDRPLHELQQAFLDLRFGMFIHFNMATFQDREWGDPTSPADLFHPTALDTDQWAESAKSAGMTWGCLTTKHHDGFCIWPTKTRSASVAHTEHKIDVVRAYVDSFRKAGLRVCLYFSILDLRENIRHFDVTADKIALIKAQLTELFTHYGEIDALIIDGWDAPWSRITYEEVPFHEIYAMIKQLQPNCLISDLNASQFPAAGLYYSDLKAFEQNAGQHIPEESSVPAYSCVTLTDGWFWKQDDINGNLKTATQVVEEWLVPQNANHCNLICNAPPTREGKLAPNIVARLKEIGERWHKPTEPAAKIPVSTVITTKNLATGRPILASSSPDTVGPDLANDGNFHSSWQPDDGKKEAWLDLDFGDRWFNTLVLIEPVGHDDYPKSRIDSYKFESFNGSHWEEIVSGGRPHQVQMHEVKRQNAKRIRLSITCGDSVPQISEIGVYDEPRRVRSS